MSLATSRSKLYTALKELRVQWEEAQRRWNDPVSKLFEERVINAIELNALAAVSAMDRLDQVLLRVKSECQ